MKFDVFEKLSPEEAETFLGQFLQVESVHIDGLVRQCSAEGVRADFGIDSIAPVMSWVAANLKTVPTAPDTQLPAWIRRTDSYAINLFELDELSKLLTLRASYYLGESFVRSHRVLRWTIGNRETAEANMPVVAGFQSELEMAPILIAENLLRRVVADPSKQADIDKAIHYWNRRV